MSLQKQLGCGYEQRIIDYLLHRRENYACDASIRQLAKDLGWRGKGKEIRAALDGLVQRGQVKRIEYKTGLCHWTLADKTVCVTLSDKSGAKWSETSSIPAWYDAQDWAQAMLRTFNHDLNIGQKPITLVGVETW